MGGHAALMLSREAARVERATRGAGPQACVSVSCGGRSKSSHAGWLHISLFSGFGGEKSETKVMAILPLSSGSAPAAPPRFRQPRLPGLVTMPLPSLPPASRGPLLCVPVFSSPETPGPWARLSRPPSLLATGCCPYSEGEIWEGEALIVSPAPTPGPTCPSMAWSACRLQESLLRR